MHYNLDCPKCGAPAEVARLKIVSGKFSAEDMMLWGDGFSFADAGRWDTQEERVFCHVCNQSFDLELCHRAYHTETLKLRGLKRISDGMLKAVTEILGTPMCVTFVKVYDGVAGIQAVKAGPISYDYYDLLCKTNPGGGGFCTTKLDGHDGDWIMILTPTKR